MLLSVVLLLLLSVVLDEVVCPQAASAKASAQADAIRSCPKIIIISQAVTELPRQASETCIRASALVKQIVRGGLGRFVALQENDQIGL